MPKIPFPEVEAAEDDDPFGQDDGDESGSVDPSEPGDPSDPGDPGQMDPALWGLNTSTVEFSDDDGLVTTAPLDANGLPPGEWKASLNESAERAEWLSTALEAEGRWFRAIGMEKAAVFFDTAAAGFDFVELDARLTAADPPREDFNKVTIYRIRGPRLPATNATLRTKAQSWVDAIFASTLALRASRISFERFQGGRADKVNHRILSAQQFAIYYNLLALTDALERIVHQLPRLNASYRSNAESIARARGVGPVRRQTGTTRVSITDPPRLVNEGEVASFRALATGTRTLSLRYGN
jgi:hypothetical protein